MPEPGPDLNVDRSDTIELDGGAAVVFCARSPLKETSNEDAALVMRRADGRAILGVADGMGGLPGGALASVTALEALERSVEAVSAGNDGGGDSSLRTAVLNGFEEANRHVCEIAGGGGTTLAVVEIDGETIRPYHVGDSVIMVVGQRGRLRLQTVCHSPVGYAVEAGLIDATDAMHHEDRHLVSNFVGSPEMHIEVGPTLTLKQHDTVILGSDGLFDNLHVEEIIATVRKGPLEKASATLASTCRRRMLDPEPGHPSKADDLTFILYRRAPPGR